MAAEAAIPRSRGSVSGLALVVLGAWGGIAPYLGPTFGYGFTPDRAWEYTQGRLVLSALPGAVALIAGLGIMLTRSRGLGGFLAVLAALGGAWLIVGGMAVRLLPASVAGSITTGSPLNLEIRHIAIADIAFFWGVGVLIVFFAALALGRFSIAAQKDSERLGAFLAGDAGAPASVGYQPVQAAQALATQPQYATDPFAAYSPDQYASQYRSEPYQQQPYPSQYPSEQNEPPAPHPTVQSTALASADAEATSDATTQTQARP